MASLVGRHYIKKCMTCCGRFITSLRPGKALMSFKAYSNVIVTAGDKLYFDRDEKGCTLLALIRAVSLTARL